MTNSEQKNCLTIHTFANGADDVFPTVAETTPAWVCLYILKMWLSPPGWRLQPEEGQIWPCPPSSFHGVLYRVADLSALDVLMQVGETPPHAHMGSQEVSVGQRVSTLRHGGGVTCEWDNKMLPAGDNLNHELVIWDTEEKEHSPESPLRLRGWQRGASNSVTLRMKWGHNKIKRGHNFEQFLTHSDVQET